MFVYTVRVVWELLQFFLSGHEYAMNQQRGLGIALKSTQSSLCSKKKFTITGDSCEAMATPAVFLIEVAIETEK